MCEGGRERERHHRYYSDYSACLVFYCRRLSYCLTRTVQLSQSQHWNFPGAGATEVEQGACLTQESTMDGRQPGGAGSKSWIPGDFPDTTLLSNPLMGGESRGCGIRVLGRLVNRRGLGDFSGSVRDMFTGQSLDRSQQLASIYSLCGSSKMCPPPSAESCRPSKANGHSLFSSKNFSCNG